MRKKTKSCQTHVNPNTEEQTLKLTLTDVETRIHRWEDTLERGLLSPEDAAHRIKNLRTERESLLKKSMVLEKKSRAGSTVRAIPTVLVKSYVRSTRERLREGKLGTKKNSYERS